MSSTFVERTSADKGNLLIGQEEISHTAYMGVCKKLAAEIRKKAGDNFKKDEMVRDITYVLFPDFSLIHLEGRDRGIALNEKPSPDSSLSERLKAAQTMVIEALKKGEYNRSTQTVCDENTVSGFESLFAAANAELAKPAQYRSH